MIHVKHERRGAHANATENLSQSNMWNTAFCVQGRFEAAIEDYSKAVKLNPRHCRVLHSLLFPFHAEVPRNDCACVLGLCNLMDSCDAGFLQQGLFLRQAR